MKAIRIFALALLLIPVPIFGADAPKHNVKPTVGYVPDAETAIRIAGQKPYRATLKDGVWTVEGSLPQDWIGGVVLAEISKDDGRILSVSHGK